MPSSARTIATLSPQEIHAFLEDCCRDVRRVGPAGFARWLERRVAHWQRDPVFAQRCRIRDLRSAHPRLTELETQRRQAQELDRQTPQFERLAEVQEQLLRTAKAIAGLSRVAGRAEKLAAFQKRRAHLLEEEAALIAASPPRRHLLAVQAELRHYRDQIGLSAEEANLIRLLRASGRRSGQRGREFEERTQVALKQHFPGADLLPGVTLGATDTEIDTLVVLPGPEVVAVVESKRNPNDLAHGARLRQANLEWLQGAFKESYRNRHYPEGLFTRADHRGYHFTPASFTRAELWLVSRRGPLWGMSSAALSRLAYRVSVDERPDPERLRRWCQKLTSDWETPDLLRAYARDSHLARRLLLVE